MGPASSTGDRIEQTTGEMILEIRRRSGLTWDLIGRLFNVSGRTINHWVNGETPSVQQERDIPRTLDAIRHLDEGSQLATHNRLMTSAQGPSPFDMLADRHYANIMFQAAGAGSAASGRNRTVLSEAEEARRRPVAPVLLLEAIQVRPETTVGAVRIVYPARRRQEATEPESTG